MRTLALNLLGALLVLAAPAPAGAGCGCDKPPPPRAAVRPFVGWADQVINLFDDRLVEGQHYNVQFQAADGTVDWSRGKAVVLRDFADRQPRVQLRVKVGNVSLGPCRIAVWDRATLLYALGDDQFTVTAAPLVLHDFRETTSRPGYQAGVGRDGTIYIPVDVKHVTDATTFVGRGLGFPLLLQPQSIVMYNDQGFLMQLLDPSHPGLFQITAGDGANSDALSYWRHEFRTYKQAHRVLDAYNNEDDPDWHADGTPHIDHDLIVLAIRGAFADGTTPAPGATTPFQLVVGSTPSDQL